jgi:Ca2+-binding RTX toxin-like protein
MTLETVVQNQIIAVYVATFGRVPDADGLAYWVNHVISDNWDIEMVAQSMFDSQEVALAYPADLSSSDFIDAIYNNVLDRDPDVSGKSYWVKELDNNIISKEKMILAVINGATAGDKQLIDNKVELGQYFTLNMGCNDIDLSKSIIKNITYDTATVKEAIDQLDIMTHSQDASVNLLIYDDNINNITIDQTATLYALDGDDLISAITGENYISAGAGNDIVNGGDSDDTIYGRDGDDTIYGNGGDDKIDGDEQDDQLHGNEGNDTILGGSGDDAIYGDLGDDTLYGGDGDDYIHTDDGADVVYGEDGDDIIIATYGQNRIDAGAGDDIVTGGADDDTINAGADNDIVNANAGADYIDGFSGNDTIHGGSGDDQIHGNSGSDILYGDSGNDTIYGEDGNDTIYGGLGADTLYGGDNIDTFVFDKMHSTLENLDTIIDFEYRVDKIELPSLIEDKYTIYGEQIDVSSATDLSTAINMSSIDNSITWFAYEDNTYIVQDSSSNEGFDSTTDIVIALQGVLDLTGLDSSNAIDGTGTALDTITIF